MNITKQEKTAAGMLVIALTLGSVLLGYRKAEPAPDTTRVLVEKGTGSAVASDTDPVPEGGDKPKPAQVVVHVGGAVVDPGVYSLPAGSRVVDALRAAGGGVSTADLDALNLAAAVADGEKVDVPDVAPAGVAATPTGGSGSTGRVNINTASTVELEALPGVGPALAARIVEHRSRNGRIGSPKDLDGVSGIGPKMLEKLKPMVVF